MRVDFRYQSDDVIEGTMKLSLLWKFYMQNAREVHGMLIGSYHSPPARYVRLELSWNRSLYVIKALFLGIFSRSLH